MYLDIARISRIDSKEHNSAQFLFLICFLKQGFRKRQPFGICFLVIREQDSAQFLFLETLSPQINFCIREQDSAQCAFFSTLPQKRLFQKMELCGILFLGHQGTGFRTVPFF